MAYDWTPERVERLRALWKEGRTSSYCADVLGVSRSAIVGKIHRIGMAGRRVSQNMAERKKIAASAGPRVPRLATPRPKPVIPVEPLPVLKADDVARVSFADLEHHHCRWPAGDPVEGFCGEPKVPGLPYCAGHAHRAYRQPQPHRPEAPTSERQPVLVAS